MKSYNEHRKKVGHRPKKKLDIKNIKQITRKDYFV